jgi:hypothetical protein
MDEKLQFPGHANTWTMRLRTFRDLAARSGDVKETEEACRIAAGVLCENRYDLPFALLSVIEKDRKMARRVSSVGADVRSNESPRIVELADPEADTAWSRNRDSRSKGDRTGSAMTTTADRATSPWTSRKNRFHPGFFFRPDGWCECSDKQTQSILEVRVRLIRLTRAPILASKARRAGPGF